jgi:serine/threonine protein kinase
MTKYFIDDKIFYFRQNILLMTKIEIWMPNFILPRTESRDEMNVKTIKKLGSGSYGIVYEINFKGKPSALKVVRKNREEESLLREEIELIQFLIKNDPNCKIEQLLCYRDISEDDGNIYFVSDLMESDLEKFRKSEPYKNLSFSEKIDIIYDITKKIVKGLDALHKVGVIHRDIKLKNILTNRKDRGYDVKIADFGISCIMEQCEGFNGTPMYLPPYVNNNKRVIKWTPRIDLYSFGITLYRLILNRDMVTSKFLTDIDNKDLNLDDSIREYVDNYDKKIKQLEKLKSKLLDASSSTQRKFDKLVSLVKKLSHPKMEDHITTKDIIQFLN